MKITLLTHEKELTRKDNTGNICLDVQELLIKRVIWRRTEPDESLVTELQNQNATLLTPHGNGTQLDDISQSRHIVILDGTWQEAKKMYNRSDYLKTANWSALPVSTPSRFNLRRNQVKGGLCTIECVIEVLKRAGKHSSVNQLQLRFDALLSQN